MMIVSPELVLSDRQRLHVLGVLLLVDRAVLDVADAEWKLDDEFVGIKAACGLPATARLGAVAWFGLSEAWATGLLTARLKDFFVCGVEDFVSCVVGRGSDLCFL